MGGKHRGSECLNSSRLQAWMIPEGDTAFNPNFGEGVAQAKMMAMKYGCL